jgi:hypothetical protein
LIVIDKDILECEILIVVDKDILESEILIVVDKDILESEILIIYILGQKLKFYLLYYNVFAGLVFGV